MIHRYDIKKVAVRFEAETDLMFKNAERAFLTVAWAYPFDVEASKRISTNPLVGLYVFQGTDLAKIVGIAKEACLAARNAGASGASYAEK